jgi:hypothetical protein
MSYNGISFECKCGYSYAEYYGNCSGDAGGLLCGILETSQTKAHCKECGFIQPKILDEQLVENLKSFYFYNQEGVKEISTSVKETKGLVYSHNNNNQCKQCNGDLQELEFIERNKIDIGWFRLSDYSYQEAKSFECPTCEEFKEVLACKEYYLDTDTKEILRKDEVFSSTCDVCDSELQEVQIKKYVKPVIHNIGGKHTYGAEDVTLAKCPKCKRFDTELYEFHWL